MSRKILTGVSAMVTVLVIFYLGYEYSRMDADPHLLSIFLGLYLDVPQKYIFNGMIYSAPIIFAASVPYGCPEFRIRLGDGMLRCIICGCVKTSVLTGAFVFLLYLISAGIYGVKFDFNSGMLLILTRLLIFYLECSLLYELLFLLSGNPVASIVAVVGINFLFLAVLLVCSFIIHLSEDLMLLTFVLYECIGTVTVLFLLCFSVRKKECL